MAGAFKKTTNLTGLEVSKNPRYTLNKIYKQLSAVLAKMPPEAAYRKRTEEIIATRSTIINSTDDIRQMEDKINCGQIEEVIGQAKKELECARFFLVVKPWERLMTAVPKNQWKWPMA